jgi:hypothetical protein
MNAGDRAFDALNLQSLSSEINVAPLEPIAEKRGSSAMELGGPIVRYCLSRVSCLLAVIIHAKMKAQKPKKRIEPAPMSQLRISMMMISTPVPGKNSILPYFPCI